MTHQSSKDTAFVTSFDIIPEEKDTMPSDYQPPGVDEEDDDEDMPQSLEEALAG